MTEIIFCQDTAASLRGRVVVMTGGSQGIGAATASLLFDLGAHVFFGDWDDIKGSALASSLQKAGSRLGGSIHFQKLDVRSYSSQLLLFETPFKLHGHIDMAVSCAAITEPSGWFGLEDLNLETVRKEPQPLSDVIDINLTSVISFCRIALAYMKTEPTGTTVDKSIVLVSSIAGITEAPGLFSYAAAKHGVIGLMRAMRPWTPTRYGVRVNAICPWATDTQLMDRVKAKWIDAKLPINTPEEVGRVILQCGVDTQLNGCAVLVSGGRGFDTETGITRTLPQWMGEENAEDFHRGQQVIGMGDDWSEK